MADENKIKITWDKKIQEIEDFFKDKELSKTIKLNDWTMILNVKNFVDTHISTVKFNNGKESFLPYLDRLFELKNYINKNK